MAIRGIKVNDANASFLELAGLSINLTTTDVLVTGWMRIIGNNGGDRGQCPFAIKDDTVGGEATFRDNTFDGASPWSMNGYDTDLTSSNSATGTWAPLTDEDWFYAMLWNHAAGVWTYYAAKDGAGSLTSATDATVTANTTLERIRVAGQFLGSYASNIEVTNVKVWTGASVASTFSASSGAAIFSEMNSENPVVTGSTLFAHWKLASSTDLADYGGHSPARDLTATGTVTNALGLNPADIIGGGGGGGGGDFATTGIQSLDNGVGAFADIQLNGLLT